MRLRPLAAVGTIVLMLATGPAKAETKALLWVQPMRDHPVHKLMQAGFLARCKEIGYQCEIVGNPSATNSDAGATLPLAEAAISRTKFGAIAVYGPDPSLYPYIGKLSREGFPVVTWHVMPKEGSVKGLLAVTGEDVQAAGAGAADSMAAKLKEKGVVALTQGSYNAIENAMADAFRTEMAAKHPGIVVLPTELEGFEPSAAKAKAIGVLQAHPEATGAFSTTGNGPETWSGAARSADRQVIIIAMDYVRQNLDLVKSGAVYGIVAQPLYEEGAKTADIAAALTEGKKVAYLNPLPARVVTAGQLDPYYAILKSAGQ